MDGLRGTTVLSLMAVAAMTTTTTTASAGRPYAAEWFQATVNSCRSAGWPNCVAQNVDRTFKLLEDADDLRIAGGVRLVRTAARTTHPTNRSSDVIDRIVSFMDSHSLQIDLWTPDNNVTVEGRRRHAYRKVFPIIVGTYMIMSAVLIPMGFMFMSTLGGKALLVSKMALMISLMSNIKKMFSYEYYVPPAPPAGPQHWKRTLLAHRTTAGPLYSSYTAY
ncbi:Protein of unknown function DUF1676 [Cinara cedri]|uniref:Uncharacterized protein n=1 Tax=Cinara cedri TaxID=506608 RepID=A0A5E4N8T1_9HEMI|nr:Protein of unknown function DUF1676 [Cinara cedri]